MHQHRTEFGCIAAALLVPLALAACSGSRDADKAAEPPQLVVAEPEPALQPPPAKEPVKERFPLPKKKPAEPKPAADKPAEPLQIGPDQVVGLTEAQTAKLLGPPDAQEAKAPASLWRYAGPNCAVTVIFYPEVETLTWRALDVEVSDSSGRGDRACLGEIAARRPRA